jgi:methylated-DNA-[protein]-cysteine S-methyltransferase
VIEADGFYRSPIGNVVLNVTEKGVSEIYFSDESVRAVRGENPIAAACIAQLDEYFKGGLHVFSVPLDLRGTEFRMKAWRALLQIPYGETSTYGRIAAAIGSPKAVRAVGGANHNNPVSIIVPCHRVIGSDGGLTGYGGGLHRKRWLLEHEAKHAGLAGALK